jgi:hypothetical protein
MVLEQARDMDEDDLQFMGWLLVLEMDRSVAMDWATVSASFCAADGERDAI